MTHSGGQNPKKNKRVKYSDLGGGAETGFTEGIILKTVHLIIRPKRAGNPKPPEREKNQGRSTPKNKLIPTII